MAAAVRFLSPVAVQAPPQAAHTISIPPRSLVRQPTIPSPSKEVGTAQRQKQSTCKDIFVCDEESHFYSQCLVKLVLKDCDKREEAFRSRIMYFKMDHAQIIEFGTGDGSPVIHALETWGQYTGVIHGFEISPSAATAARHSAAAHGVSNQYKVLNSCFFKGLEQLRPSILVANPPYIAAPDNDIMMPALHGGVDGANLTRDLMSLGLDKVMLLISSYSNPVETLQHARRQGYILRDFMVTAMPFGKYSSEPKVMRWITQMKDERKAFFSPRTYLLAGVLLVKPSTGLRQQKDLTDEVLAVMTALH